MTHERQLPSPSSNVPEPVIAPAPPVPVPTPTEPPVAAGDAPASLPRRVLFAGFAAGFAVAAVMHLVRAFVPEADDPSGGPRHALFFAVDLAAAAGVLVRPRWLLVPFVVLFAQQMMSHGGRAWRALLDHGPAAMPPADVAVAVFFPLVLAALLDDALRASDAAHRRRSTPKT